VSSVCCALNALAKKLRLSQSQTPQERLLPMATDQYVYLSASGSQRRWDEKSGHTHD
jgi:hypothetical protein